MDRISLLPDEILGHILSFLPTKQAVSTSLLSKRWRNVFLLVSTLDLHYDEYIDWRKFVDDHDPLEAQRRCMYDSRKKFMDFVDSLLSRQGKSPIKRITLNTYGCDLDPTRVRNWIFNVLERGVVDLNLSSSQNSQFLSPLIFKNNTLVKLTLGDGFKINLSQDVYLPKLKTLCLGAVVFDGVHDAVCETLLPRCPVLEELVIQTWVKGSSLEARRRYMYDNRKKLMGFVDSLLSLQGKSPIEKFTLKIYGCDLDPTRVQSWIRNVLERGVVDLHLFYGEKDQLLSSLIFKNNTLVKLTLGDGFKINLSQDVYLPKLKTLCLGAVVFDGVHDDVCETLLPRCPVLEELVIQTWIKGSSVSSRSLKKLTIRFFTTKTISFDVPNLVYLELSCYFGVKFYNVNLDSLIEARLNLSVNECRLRKLRKGSARFIRAEVSDTIIQMRNVRVLHLTSGALEMFYFSGQKLPKFDNLVCLCILSEKTHGWQILPLLIMNSPNLETLIFKGLEHYKATNCGDVCYCTGSKENIPSCLSSCHVKVLEIWGYKGCSEEVNQMKHFLKRLPCLKLVKIKAVDNLEVPIFIQHLLKFPRASLNCKFQAIL